MTEKQIQQIETLRNQGKSWRIIAKTLNYPFKPENMRETYKYRKEAYDKKQLQRDNRFYSIHAFGAKPTAFKEVA